jgi:predicted anti-sigma-YlaC factor YlaD
MTSCESFEVAIEMRLHGALARDREADLLQHLAECAGCRAFQTVANDTERAMTQTTQTQLQAVDWETLLSRTVGFIDGQRPARDVVRD